MTCFCRWLIVLALLPPLAGCGNLLQVPRGPSNLFNLTPKSTFDPALPNADWQLVIDEPLAAGGLDTSRIALRPSPIELKYIADSRWTERAPRMVQTLLVESFENSRHIVAVGRQTIGLRSDFNLQTELREFQFEDFGNRLVRVGVNAKLIRQPRQEIVSSRNFEATAAVSGSEMQQIIRAWDDALGVVLRDIVEWTLIEGDRAQRGTES